MRQPLPVPHPAKCLAALALLTTRAFAQTPDAPAHEPAQAPPISAESPAASEPPSASTAPIDEVIVTGEHPGPGLWKITHGGSNVVWVLGTVGGIPKEMKWRSRQVEDVVAHAQAVIFGESVSPNISMFRGLLLLPTVLKARFNPDKAILKDIITPERYEKWLPLRAQYFKDDDDIERVRPMFIAMGLTQKASAQAGINSAFNIGRVVAAAAKKHNVPIKNPEVKIDLPDPKQAIRDFTGTPREKEIECFNATLDNLEGDIAKAKLRANAWAVGDVEAFRKLPAPVATPVCNQTLTSAPALQGEFTRVKEKAVQTWLWEIEKALELNKVTLAVMSLDDLLSPTGRLSRLRERGYTIEAAP